MNPQNPPPNWAPTGPTAPPAWQQQPQQQPWPPQPNMPPPQPMPAGSQPAWLARAMRRPPFIRLVRAEFRKFSGTLSDRILLVVGPLVLIGFAGLLDRINAFDGTWSSQIGPILIGLIYSPLAFNALLVKLISGEWQYRSAQPTLLVQPSRLRYLAAQSTIAIGVWIFYSVVAVVLLSLLSPPVIAAADLRSLLGIRPGLVILTGAVAALIAVAWALVIALLVPNAAGALAIYLISVPALNVLQGLLPNVVSWLNPFRIPPAVAGVDPTLPAASAYTAGALLVVLLVIAVLRYRRREAA